MLSAAADDNAPVTKPASETTKAFLMVAPSDVSNGRGRVRPLA